MNEVKQNQQVTPQRLMQLAWGYAIPLMIEGAVQHRVFDVLESGPKTVDQIASETGASKRALRMVLNALTAFELLARDGQHRYSLTPESAAFLVKGKPSYLGGLFGHTSSQLMPKWQKLPTILRTGKPETSVNQEGSGSGFFEQFVEDIFPMSYPSAQRLAEVLKIGASSSPVRVLDLATGSGVWGIALAQKSPHVTVTAVDWKNVLPVTRRVAQRHGLADRFKFVEGDLASVGFGTGHNVATLGHILHSEGEQRSRALLKKTFAALAPGGTIAIAEFLCNDDRSGPPNALVFAVNMLVHTEQGDTFTVPEISSWLKEAGFTDIRTVESLGPSPLILATKPK